MKFLPKKYRNPEALAAQAAAFSERLATVEKIEQPADRLEALMELRVDVSDHVLQMGRDFGRRVGNFEMAGFLGAFATFIGGGVALAVVVTPFVGVPVAIAGLAGLLSEDAWDPAGKMLRRMMKDISGHVDAINAVLGKASDDVDDLLKNRAPEIAASEKFGSLYDRYPGIRDSFIKTFNQSVARKEVAAAETPVAKPATKLQL